MLTGQSDTSLQVFAFVKSDQSNASPHRAECHVCECALEFRTKAEVLNFLHCILIKETIETAAGLL